MGDAEWVTPAYIPNFGKGKEPGAGRHAQLRHSAILQGVLYLIFHSAIAVSHLGVKVRLLKRELLAFPRLLFCSCDLPEKETIFCHHSGECAQMCPVCDVRVTLAGAPAALSVRDRDARNGLARQVESANLSAARKNPKRRLIL